MNDRDDPSDPEEDRGSPKGPLPRCERPDEACGSHQQLDRVRDVGDAIHDFGSRATSLGSHAAEPSTAAPMTGKVRFHPEAIQPKRFVHQCDRQGDPVWHCAMAHPVGKARTTPAMNPATANATMSPDRFRARHETMTALYSRPLD